MNNSTAKKVHSSSCKNRPSIGKPGGAVGINSIIKTYLRWRWIKPCWKGFERLLTKNKPSLNFCLSDQHGQMDTKLSCLPIFLATACVAPCLPSPLHMLFLSFYLWRLLSSLLDTLLRIIQFFHKISHSTYDG